MWQRWRAIQTGSNGEGNSLDEELTALRSILDPAAFEPLYRRYLPEILALCRRRLGPGPDAEDAAADVFGKVLARRDTFHGGSFRAWIYTIALNTIRDSARRPLPPVALFDTHADRAPGPEELAIRAATDAEVSAALARLPDDWQLVVELRQQGYPCAEVGATLGRDPAWVRLTHHRAMQRLARDLGGVRQTRRARVG